MSYVWHQKRQVQQRLTLAYKHRHLKLFAQGKYRRLMTFSNDLEIITFHFRSCLGLIAPRYTEPASAANKSLPVGLRK